MQRQEREQFAQEQKEAALRRAADLVRSNRIPIEITRGAAVVKTGEWYIWINVGYFELYM